MTGLSVWRLTYRPAALAQASGRGRSETWEVIGDEDDAEREAERISLANAGASVLVARVRTYNGARK